MSQNIYTHKHDDYYMFECDELDASKLNGKTLYERLDESVKKTDEAVGNSMSWLEKFIFYRSKNTKLKKFILRNYKLSCCYYGDFTLKDIEVYKKDKLIFTFRISEEPLIQESGDKI